MTKTGQKPDQHSASARLQKYLSQYAEPEANLPWPSGAGPYQFCLTVPAFDETPETLRTLWSQFETHKNYLLILVINSPKPHQQWASTLVEALEHGHDILHLNDQQRLIYSTTEPIDPNALHRTGAKQPDILLIDRFSDGLTIDSQQGVGRARKIAADIAAHLITQGIIYSPWIFATDADAVLPADYFDIDPLKGDAAITYPFRHKATPALQRACDLYELSMLYYVAGLKHAGSPYAFPTIGSTIASHVEAYAAVRGYPCRATGEDFYLLNKLRKIGDVRTLDRAPIILEGRESERVPIGTGRAITRIQQQPRPWTKVQVEHPDCFEDLHDFLTMLRWVAVNGHSPADYHLPVLVEYAASSGLTTKVEKALAQNQKVAVVSRHLTDIFDGLRTRQFIHHFRDHHHGSIAIGDIAMAAFVNGLDAPSQREQLMQVIVRQSAD